MRIVLATLNAHKVVELRTMFQGIPHLEWLGLGDFPEIPEPPETAETFEGNALQKARFVHERTGLVAVADDSGLEVDALGGAPGVRSKRFSPEETDAANNALLLEKLAGRTDRRARYRCVLACVGPEGEFTFDGRCEGAIGDTPRGSQGFGYDPLFWPDTTPGRAMAELALADKNAISHRGEAVRRFVSWMQERAR